MELVSGSADQKLIEKWSGKIRSAQQARIKFEKQWHENMLFFGGKQWIQINKTVNGGFSIVETVSKDNWRVRHTANRIKRIIRTELTKCSKEQTQWFVLPDSMDESDRLAAMAGESIAEFLLRTKYFNRRRTVATFWALICGTSYLKNWYDPNKIENDGLPGKIDFEPVTAFHLFVENLQATEMEEQPWADHARTMSPEDVYNCYGIEIEPGTDASRLLVDSRFLQSIGINQTKSADKQCYLHEVYVKKCKDFPNGAMFIFADETMVYVYEAKTPDEMLPAGMPLEKTDDPLATLDQPESDEPPVGPLPPVGYPKSAHEGLEDYKHEFPYRHGRYPFTKIDHIPTGMWYADSVIKDLIPPQKEYNRTRSAMMEYRNMAAKPQYWHISGAFDPRKWNSKPGLTLPVHMGFEPPKPIEQPDPPSFLQNELDNIVRDMDDISSQSEVSKGKTPPGVEAASAIAYLAEENDSILLPTIESLEACIQETGVQVLANVHDYWDPQRVVRMTSKNQYLEVREFMAKDLNPLTDFRVEPGSMAPRSLAAKQAFMIEIIKLGAVPPEKVLKYLQMSETDKLYDELMLDVRHASRENVYMMQGMRLTKPDINAQPQVDPETGMLSTEPAMKSAELINPETQVPEVDPTTGQPMLYQVTTNSYDNHSVHVEEHEKFQKSQEYELLPPEIQQIIQDHVDEHKLEMIKETMVVNQQQMAQGIPPEESKQLESVSPNGNGEAPQYGSS